MVSVYNTAVLTQTPFYTSEHSTCTANSDNVLAFHLVAAAASEDVRKCGCIPTVMLPGLGEKCYFNVKGSAESRQRTD